MGDLFMTHEERLEAAAYVRERVAFEQGPSDRYNEGVRIRASYVDPELGELEAVKHLGMTGAGGPVPEKVIEREKDNMVLSLAGKRLMLLRQRSNT